MDPIRKGCSILRGNSARRSASRSASPCANASGASTRSVRGARRHPSGRLRENAHAIIGPPLGSDPSAPFAPIDPTRRAGDRDRRLRASRDTADRRATRDAVEARGATDLPEQGAAASCHQPLRISASLSAGLRRRMRVGDRCRAEGRGALRRRRQLPDRLAGRRCALPQEVITGAVARRKPVARRKLAIEAPDARGHELSRR